jgi:hypothetical protein
MHNIENSSLLDYREKHEVYEFMSRYMQPACKGKEYLLLLFIYNRTIMWGKTKERIPHRHFIEGVYSQEGMLITYRCGVNKNTLIKSIKELEDNNLIIKYEESTNLKGAVYGLNLDYKGEVMINKEKKLSESSIGSGNLSGRKIEESKLSGGIKEDPLEVSQLNPRRCISDTTGGISIKPPEGQTRYIEVNKRKIDKTKVNKKLIAASNESAITDFSEEGENTNQLEENKKESFAGRAQEILASSKKRYEDKYQKLLTKKKPKSTEFVYVWTSRIKLKYPDFPVSDFTKRELAMVNQFMKKLNLGDSSAVLEFVEWSIDHWRMVTNTILKSLKSKPDYPDLGFLIRFKNEFIQARSKESYYQELATDDLYSRVYKSAIRKGMTEEQAKNKAKQEVEKEEEQSSLSKERMKIKKAKEALKKTKEQTKKEIDDYKALTKREIDNRAKRKLGTKTTIEIGNIKSEEELSEEFSNLEPLKDFSTSWD